jgi:cell shape-determining protein MreC
VALIIRAIPPPGGGPLPINRGKQDGIDSDMPVVTDEGLVGKTTTVSANITIVLPGFG